MRKDRARDVVAYAVLRTREEQIAEDTPIYEGELGKEDAEDLAMKTGGVVVELTYRLARRSGFVADFTPETERLTDNSTR